MFLISSNPSRLNRLEAFKAVDYQSFRESNIREKREWALEWVICYHLW